MGKGKARALHRPSMRTLTLNLPHPAPPMIMPLDLKHLLEERNHRSSQRTLPGRWRERLILGAWRRAMARRGLSWLDDTLPPAQARAAYTLPDAAASLRTQAEDVVMLGTGNSLAAQLDAIGSDFVKDILVRRAACAMAQLHESGGYVGHARADDIDVMGNEIGFCERECEACERLGITQAQTHDWLLFASSVAPHYDKRAGDLAAILFRPMHLLAKPSSEQLLATIEALRPLEHAWYRLCGRRIRAMRTALLALRSGLAWQGVPAPPVHALGSRGTSQYAILRYLDSGRRTP